MSQQVRGELKITRQAENTRGGFMALISGLVNLPKPVIAAVNGPAAALGFSIVLACDLVIASENATFREAFIKRGLIASGGATFSLPRRVGLPKAKEILFLGDIIDAKEAERLGIVNHVYPADEFELRVKELASQLAEGPPKALAYMKSLVNKGLWPKLESVFIEENQAQFTLFESDDFKEGVQSFIEKRRPRFKGE